MKNEDFNEDADLETGKEILRQGELRIKGILDFSKELDNKIFKLLGFTITITMGLLFYLFKEYSKLESDFIYTCVSAIVLFIVSIIFLLIAGKPTSYKGVGLPLEDFEENGKMTKSNFIKIISNSRKRYTARFKHNKELNDQKAKWLNFAI